MLTVQVAIEGSHDVCIQNRRRSGKQTGSPKTTVCGPFLMRGWNCHHSPSRNPFVKCNLDENERSDSSDFGIIFTFNMLNQAYLG